MLPRFLADTIDARSGTAQLGEDEARHLSQVLRLGIGDEVAVFDGAGREFRARVERVTRSAAEVRLIAEADAAPEPAVRLTLAQAALKGEKMDDVVRDATMMGASAIEPLVTANVAAHLKAGRAPERWRRIAIASAKQCRRAVVPRIGAGMEFDAWLADDRSALRLLLVEPAGAVEARRLADLARAPPESVSLLVGPEGGWSAAEVSSAVAAGCVPLTLGRRTLRADAVPVIAIGVIQSLWGDL
ncbi:MAG TPA: 16S rRNA (uracil(1498)-N(3))-methyltransferase [Vicinamibacterales bacterium]|nr:16S rRNA (uracil(1498)-N(3))-methyltransferase [Vicinamibacterales bacterium]